MSRLLILTLSGIVLTAAMPTWAQEPAPAPVAPTPTPVATAGVLSTPTAIVRAPDGSVVIHTQVASRPIPDTRANRALYGAPISHAGKRTAAAGN